MFDLCQFKFRLRMYFYPTREFTEVDKNYKQQVRHLNAVARFWNL
jgi:hypothetical protein